MPTKQTGTLEDVGAVVRRVPQRFERNVKLTTLRAWPGNPKGHDIDALVAMMRANGRYGVLYAQMRTRRILAGHGRKQAYKRLGVTAVDVVWLDVDTETGARIVAADNRSVELGETDDATLLKFLGKLETLEGTGYDSDDMAQLRASLDAVGVPAEDRAPDPDDTDAGNTFQVIVSCTDKKAQRALITELRGRGLAARTKTVKAKPAKA